MFIEYIAPDCYQIPLADLKRHSDGGIERSFATSEQAIEWIKNHPGLVVKAVPRRGRGEKLAPQKPDPNFTGVNCYSLENGDIICGDLLVYDQLGLRKPGPGPGSG
jgi:hypothetical protein